MRQSGDECNRGRMIMTSEPLLFAALRYYRCCAFIGKICRACMYCSISSSPCLHMASILSVQQ